MDNVNHPKHYEGNCSIECIDAMRFALGDEALAYFCAGNAFKYLWRYKFKNGQEDIDKAKWYMVKMSELSYDNDYNRDSDKVIMKLYSKVSRLYLTVTGKEKNAVFDGEEEVNDN